jgi:ribosomal protein S18 acetylase RimI-like enzyme
MESGMDWFTADPFSSTALGRDAWVLSRHPLPGEEAAFSRECAGRMAAPGFFASAKVPVRDVAGLEVLMRAGFALVDTNLRFERPAGPGVPSAWSGTIRFAEPRDEAEVRRMAAENLTLSRFHLDPRIGAETAAWLKAEWAGNFFSGRRGHAMAVAEERGGLAGFLLLLASGSDLVIDLVAVDVPFRRRGVAAAMLGFAMSSLPGFGRVLTGTQAANAASVRFYEAQGFRFDAAAHMLHAHGGVHAHR